MRIALDAMGGDHAPQVTVEGALLAEKSLPGLEIILVGREKEINDELARHNAPKTRLSVHNADEVIEMDEPPAQAVRQKKNSSMFIAAKLAAEGKADAFVSVGNSGATMASALLNMKRLPGVSRPAILTVFPTIKGVCAILDVGANVDCKPKHLLQFAVMGSIYMNKIYGIDNPRVGLLSIGEEETKGNELSLSAYGLLKDCGLNFIGNAEGRDITRGNADIVVCDGFVGNVLLKFGEGVAEMMIKLVKEELKAHPMAWFSLPFLWAALKDLNKRVDYSEHGGAPLLGVDGVCIMGHGRSNSKAIKNAVLAAANFAEKNINKEIAEDLAKRGIDRSDE